MFALQDGVSSQQLFEFSHPGGASRSPAEGPAKAGMGPSVRPLFFPAGGTPLTIEKVLRVPHPSVLRVRVFRVKSQRLFEFFPPPQRNLWVQNRRKWLKECT
jgi:hypothetical protein